MNTTAISPGPQTLTTPIGGPSKFFDNTDRRSFLLACGVALTAYLWTLAPSLTLGFSGIFTTAASHGGVAHPPGYPLWTLYAWLFTKLLPFSDLAWRVAVSSAVAAALVCGLIAMMVSRGGAMILEAITASAWLKPEEQRRLRMVCGCVAGLGVGFSNGFWREAVVASTWPFSILLFTTTLWLLMWWVHQPERLGVLYSAALVYSLSISNSQLLLAAGLGVQLLVMLGQPKFIRDLCLINGILFAAALLAHAEGQLVLLAPHPSSTNLLRAVFITVGAASVVQCTVLALKTRALFTEWKPVLKLSLALCLGAMPYLYVPLVSMTNPPMNWGYPRTIEGFLHVLSRGQYERIQPTVGVERFGSQLQSYSELVLADLGLSSVVATLAMVYFLPRIHSPLRNWMIGLITAYITTTCLLILVLNQPPDRQSLELVKGAFTASHVLFSLCAGYGLVVLAIVWTKPKATTVPCALPANASSPS